eukprot:SAG31_NODE_40_length_31360_cov_6.751575_4_plen_91_part_00
MPEPDPLQLTAGATETSQGEEDFSLNSPSHELGIDPAAIAFNNVKNLMKVVNEITVEWGKNGLVRQKIENTVKSLRLYGKSALEVRNAIA